MVEVNISEVVAEVWAAFDRYNRAVDDNDVAVMNEMFWDSPHTVRYGRAENLYGSAEIAAYRTTRKTKIERSYPRTVITTFGRDFAIAWTETCLRVWPRSAGRAKRGCAPTGVGASSRRMSATWRRLEPEISSVRATMLVGRKKRSHFDHLRLTLGFRPTRNTHG